MSKTSFKKGQFVRSRGGYAARALGIERFCLCRSAHGRLFIDLIRQADVNVLHTQVPSEKELEHYLATHQKGRTTARESPRAPKTVTRAPDVG